MLRFPMKMRPKKTHVEQWAGSDLRSLCQFGDPSHCSLFGRLPVPPAPLVRILGQRFGESNQMMTMSKRMMVLLVVGGGHLPPSSSRRTVLPQFFEVSSLRVCPCGIDKFL